jgi:hypothetical protein
MADSPNTTTAPERDAADDPLVEIGREITRLYDRIRVLDAREGLTPIEKNYAADEHSDLWDRIDCLRAYATTLQAKSLTGALVQLGIAAKLFDDATEDRNAPEWKVDTAGQRFKRVIYSIIKPVANACDPDVGDHAFYVHRPEYMNPWVGYERQVAWTKLDTEADRELEQADRKRRAQS